jgi:hypothetical protein
VAFIILLQNRRLRRRDSSNYSELFAAQVAGSTGLAKKVL